MEADNKNYLVSLWSKRCLELNSEDLFDLHQLWPARKDWAHQAKHIPWSCHIWTIYYILILPFPNLPSSSDLNGSHILESDHWRGQMSLELFYASTISICKLQMYMGSYHLTNIFWKIKIRIHYVLYARWVHFKYYS